MRLDSQFSFTIHTSLPISKGDWKRPPPVNLDTPLAFGDFTCKNAVPRNHGEVLDSKYLTGETAACQASDAVRMLLTNGDLMLLTAGYFAADYFEYIFFCWAFYYLGQIRHMGAAQSAVYTTGLFLSWMLFAPPCGKVSDLCVRRFGPRKGMRIDPIGALSLSAVLLFAALGLRSAEMTGVLMALGLAAATDGSYWAQPSTLAAKTQVPLADFLTREVISEGFSLRW